MTPTISPDDPLQNDERPSPSATIEPEVAVIDSADSIAGAGADAALAQSQKDDAQTRSTGRSVARATAGIVPLQFSRLLMGFIAQPLMAHIFGLRWESDAYTVAANIQEKLWLLFEKVVNPSVLPCFMKALHEDDEERAWKFASTVIWLTLIALCILTPLAWWGMPGIVYVYSWKTAAFPERMALTVSIARLLLSGLFFLGMSSLTYVILNGYKRFTIAALGDALWKAGILGGVLAAMTLHAPPERALTIISLGFIAGAFLKLFPHLLGLKSKWKFLRPRIDLRDPLTHKMMLLAIPLVCGILISESRDVYIQRLADHKDIGIEAGRTAWKYSRLIGANLIQIFPYALSVGVFPYLADLARSHDRQPLTDTLVGTLRVCIFVFGPLTAILIALRTPLLRAVWESGNFTLADTVSITGPFVAISLGLVAFSCEMMLNQTYYAMTNAWTPTLIGMTTSALWAGIATWGVTNGYGLTAIAAAESIAKTTKCLLMWILLRPKLGDVRVRENLIFVAKVLLGAIAAAFIANVVADSIAPVSADVPRFKIKMLLAVTFAGCSGLVVYIMLGALAGVNEVRAIFNFVSRLKQRLKRA